MVQSMGEMSVVNWSHVIIINYFYNAHNTLQGMSLCAVRKKRLVYFNFFEARNDAFGVQFFRCSFLHPITDTDSRQGHTAAQLSKSGSIVKECL